VETVKNEKIYDNRETKMNSSRKSRDKKYETQ